MINYAKDTGRDFTLYYQKGAKISQPLQDAIYAIPGGVMRPIVPPTVELFPVFVPTILIDPYYTNYGDGRKL